MSSEVAEMITALRNGTMTLDEVADRFRKRSWPGRATPAPATYLELAAAAQQDPPPDVPGSFDEVTAAYDRGELTRAAYRRLAEAAAASAASEDDPRESGEPPGDVANRYETD
jgi:hypothetical protein